MEMKLYDFRVEYQDAPQGLGVSVPRFSWKLSSQTQNTMQKAYRIVVKTGDQPVWDSGRTESGRSVLVPCGTALEEETQYRAEVIAEDCHGNEARCETSFSTGLFDGKSLSAKMITHDFPDDETACPVFYTTFQEKKQVKRALLYVTAQGVYEASLNGNRIGEDYLTPGWTEYSHRLQFQNYDVTKWLAEENLLEITVGNGWYKGIIGWDVKPNRYGSRVACLGELRIDYTDGTRRIIKTGEDWKVRTGVIRYSELYMGETQDLCAPAGQEGRVLESPFERAVLVPQLSEPVRITGRIPAQKMFTDPKGNLVVDFGQNLAGFAEIRIQGRPSQRVEVTHAETLDKDGVFYPDTLRTAISRDVYLLNGEEQVLKPHFTYHGFRYLCVKGIEAPVPEMFSACVLHSDMEQIGSFQCSNKDVARLWNNIQWSLRSNFVDVPTDCPQRDERLGWTGDAQVFSHTAVQSRNTALFFAKWLRDMAAVSSLEKGVPHVIPDIQGSTSSAAWSDAAVIIPWAVYRAYGDERILEENWTLMHEWVDYIRNHSNENGLWMSGYQFGDWLALDREKLSEDSEGATDVYLAANACYLHITDLVAKAAGVLGKEKEAAYYRNLYEEVLQSFREEYYTSRGRIVSQTQTACVLSLYFQLAYPEHRERILKTLTDNIEKHKTHLTTGFVGTPYLCHALSESGAHELAGELFMREDCPSWLYEVKQGATTIWERWDAILPDGTMQHPGLNSMNHYANGAIGDWMMQKLGGIQAIEAGYRRFMVCPMPVKGIEEAEASLESPYGTIRVHWSCRQKTFRMEVTVPCNTTAQIVLPEKGGQIEVGSGNYTWEYTVEMDLRPPRYSFDSTIGEIMETPKGLELMNELLPELVSNPMIEFIKNTSVAAGLGSAAAYRPIFGQIIDALNAE